MKLKELKKIYEYDEFSKSFKLGIQLEEYRDAYSNWDFSPYNNRDLDDDLIEYLLECSYEIPIKYILVIEFHLLHQSLNSEREKKSILGMRNFFGYQLRKLKGHKYRMMREIIQFLVIGSILLTSGLYLTPFKSKSLALTILTEGFYIGGWVMLWEMFTSWFFDIKKINTKIRHFERLLNADINYLYSKNHNSF